MIKSIVATYLDITLESGKFPLVHDVVKSSDALLKKPEVIGHQVQGHYPRGKHKNRQGNLETSCHVRDVMTIEGMVGDNRL